MNNLEVRFYLVAEIAVQIMVVKTAFYAEKIRNSFTSHIKFVNCVWIKYLFGRIVQVFFY